MGRVRLLMWAAVLTAGSTGCQFKPYLIEPALPPQDEPVEVVENPIYFPLGPQSYGHVFEKAIDVIDDYFEIAYANRYDGRIETHPRIAPGCEQPWKPGNPDVYGRSLATLQTMRHRAFILIQPADDGGFFIQVTVFRELEDLPQPIRNRAGAAAFQSDNTVDRPSEVIDPTVFDRTWIPLGRDFEFEQSVLEKLKKCM